MPFLIGVWITILQATFLFPGFSRTTAVFGRIEARNHLATGVLGSQSIF